MIQAVKNEDKLVMISAGKDQEVDVGFLFTVYRGDRVVGKVQVIKVYDDRAGVKIPFTSDNNQEQCRVGDRASKDS